MRNKGDYPEVIRFEEHQNTLGAFRLHFSEIEDEDTGKKYNVDNVEELVNFYAVVQYTDEDGLA